TLSRINKTLGESRNGNELPITKKLDTVLSSSEILPPPKRRVGRPRKNPVTVESSVHTPDVGSSEPVTPKVPKKTRRPQKVVESYDDTTRSTIENVQNTPFTMNSGFLSHAFYTPELTKAVSTIDNALTRSPSIIQGSVLTDTNIETPSKGNTIEKGESIANVPEIDLVGEETEDEHGYIDRTEGISKDLVPKQGETLKFGQLYIFDPANEVQNRINVVSSRDNGSSSSTKDIDPYAGQKLATGDQNVKIRLLGRRPHDGRQYNLPTANEVAALIVGDFDSMPDERDIIVHENSDGYQTNIYHKGITDDTPKHKKNLRYMLQNYLDAMAMCKFYGYPNLFITFTCNPKWPEITRFLKKKGLKSEDRPDVTSRVFKMKLDQLMKDIKEKEIFRRVRADDKLRLPTDIDRCISAEIPNKEVDPELHQLEKEFMMHGPYGPEHRSCPCMVENKCSKSFPKKFNEATFIDESGYAIYKRSDNGRTVMKQGAEFDGGYVVPYNPTLLKRVHIELPAVEDEETDEIKDYYDCRYLSSYEAAWRIFKFDIHHRFPVVERLPFHLPNQQSVMFDPSESIDYQLEKKLANTSKFLAWMEINKTDTEAQKLLYVEFPEYYVWNKTDKIWTKRKQGYKTMSEVLKNGKILGRMITHEIVWEKAWRLLAEDVLELERRKQNNPDLQLTDIQRYNICLTYIEDKLLSCSKSLKNIVNMPYPNDEFTMEGYNRSLTNEQKGIYETILDACNNNTGGMFFVYGYEGIGKTFLYKILTAALRSKGQIFLNVASSGIASLLLDGGRTTCFVNSSQSSDNVFGGKVVVFGGDFHQILPVIPNGSRQEVVHASLNMSYLWKHCTVLKLTQNMRLRVGCNPNDAEEINEFAELILNIGEGNIGGKIDGHAEVEFFEEMLIPDSDDHVESVIKETYDNWEEKLWDPTYFQDRAILAPTHEQVDKVNERMMSKLPGRENVCYSSDSVSDVEIDFNYVESMYTTEFLNTIRMSGIPNHKLVLKIGVVMCLRNIDQRGGLCNCTRLQIVRMRVTNIEAKIISDGKVGTIVAIPRMNISPSDKKMPFQLNRRQYSIVVCFAMTINKSQGQTLSKVSTVLIKRMLGRVARETLGIAYGVVFSSLFIYDICFA
ncbi:uncharacterized protein Tco_1522537, partial [Tanacetum coccineum]